MGWRTLYERTPGGGGGGGGGGGSRGPGAHPPPEIPKVPPPPPGERTAVQEKPFIKEAEPPVLSTPSPGGERHLGYFFMGMSRWSLKALTPL